LVQSQASPCGIRAGQSDMWIGRSQVHHVFPVSIIQHYFTKINPCIGLSYKLIVSLQRNRSVL